MKSVTEVLISKQEQLESVFSVEHDCQRPEHSWNRVSKLVADVLDKECHCGRVNGPQPWINWTRRF